MTLPVERIGGKIRALRKKQAQTLEDLSQITGLSKGLISQVERGISQPSLETLWKITKALDTPIVHFFEEVSHSNVHVIRKGDRKQIVFPGSNGTIYLTGQSHGDKLKILEITLQPGEFTDLQSIYSEGEDSVVVTQGELLFELSEEKHTLKAGDSVFFEGQERPKLKNERDEPVICLLTTFGKL